LARWSRHAASRVRNRDTEAGSVVSTSSLELFFSAATQYYVSGRYAVLAGLVPVAGNLLHHAIEMYLKGGLSKAMTLDQLKVLRHNLPKVWASFKAQAQDPTLNNFDALMSSLSAFEELRYPDSILARGMAVTIGVNRLPDFGSAPTSAVLAPKYELYLEEIDALVNKIFEIVSVNQAFFLNGLNCKARDYLEEANAQRWAG
jgi:hypothetical protein